MGAQSSRVAELRRARHLTQLDVATSLGVSLSTVRRWESGESAPTARNARRLARRLGVSVEALGLAERSG
jgi:transcriptional regulator with XRE-family HTH domain